MDENHIPEGLMPEAAEPDLQESMAEPEPVETRGLGWVFVPALLGVLIGAFIGVMKAGGPVAPGTVRGSLLEAASTGGTIGLIAGAVLGLLVWVLFPYKGRNPHAYKPEDQPAKTAPEGMEEHGGL